MLAISLTASLLGWALLALLVFVLSLSGPLTGAATPLVGAALIVLHVVVAGEPKVEA